GAFLFASVVDIELLGVLFNLGPQHGVAGGERRLLRDRGAAGGLRDQGPQVGDARLRGLGYDRLGRRVVGQVGSAQVDAAHGHPRAAEGYDGAAGLPAETQQHNGAARLVLPQKAAAPAADDNGRHLLLVLLHVDTAAVARVPLDVDGAAPHGVACGVPAGAVDDDFPAVHGVAGGVLGVAEHLHRGAVPVGAQ